MFDYEELEPASLKGKTEPVRVFHAKAARARFGTDLTRTHDTPFIGREIDLALLKGIFDKTVASGSVQLVTVVGEPGLGKSRIVAELFGYIDARPEFTTWRQGRCLPYGEGISFWALGEILKAHTGILESDLPAVAQEKLTAVLPEGDEREWFRQRLLPLLGVESTSTAEREELFTAWRRFLEGVAEERPTVLVFEDLHWADEALLAFLEHLADLAEGVPLLLVGTARPELFERARTTQQGCATRRRSTWPRSPRRRPARLVSALLESTVIPAELQQPILDRAEGNPLYAEEFVRLLKDRDLLIHKGSSWELRGGCRSSVPGVGAGADRRPPGHPRPRRQVAARGRRGDRQGVLGRGGRGDGRARPADRDHHPAGAVAQGACPSRPAVVDGRGGRILLLARPRPRRRLQPAPAGIPRRPARRRRHLDRVKSARARGRPG